MNFKRHPGLGMLWFIVSMFFGFQIINGIALLFHGGYRGYLYAALAFIGMYLGTTQKWLPLNFDVTLVCAFFSIWEYCGKSIRNFWKSIVGLFSQQVLYFGVFVSRIIGILNWLPVDIRCFG